MKAAGKKKQHIHKNTYRIFTLIFTQQSFYFLVFKFIALFF